VLSASNASASASMLQSAAQTLPDLWKDTQKPSHQKAQSGFRSEGTSERGQPGLLVCARCSGPQTRHEACALRTIYEYHAVSGR